MKCATPTPGQRILLLAIVLVVTLLAGLDPRDYDFQNHVQRTGDGAGLRFEKYGVAFTKPIIDEVLAESLNEKGFQISLTLGSEAKKQEGFAFIAQIHSGDDQTQLVVGRWSDYLIVMNGDDYKHRLKHPRISARLPEARRNNGVEVRIHSSKNGTRIWLGEELVAERKDLILRIPSSAKAGRVVLGNSTCGTHFWLGEIERFELRDLESAQPQLSYHLGSLLRYGVLGSGTINRTLWVPPRSVVVERKFLQWPINHQFELNRSFVSDFALNLFGFVPFGFALTGVLRWLGFPRIRCFVTAFIVSMLVSLLIESAQTWFPSRSSSSLDLVLNIVGGMLGVLVWDRLFRSEDGFKKRPVHF